MVQVGDSVSELERIVMREARHARSKPNRRCLAEHSGDQQVRRWNALPGAGVVLTDPGFFVPESISQDQQIHIALKRLLCRHLRWMQRHGEKSELHLHSFSVRWPAVGAFASWRALLLWRLDYQERSIALACDVRFTDAEHGSAP